MEKPASPLYPTHAQGAGRVVLRRGQTAVCGECV